MDDQSCEILQHKTIDLLNLFFFQSDYKYKFKSDIYNFIINTRDKSTTYLPKSIKYFKKILKHRTPNAKTKIKNKCHLKKDNLNDLKSMKRKECEQNTEDAVIEATVLVKIADLKKKGIWTRECLPKVMEPHRLLCHWDYLLQEIQLVSSDFNSRLRWKIFAAKILAQNAMEYVSAKSEIERLEHIHLQHRGRFHCSIIAKMIKEWWQSKEEKKCSQSTNPYSKLKFDTENNVMDYCQIWLSKSLINAESDAVTSDFQHDRSDSDSLCSFGSDIHSIMLNDDDFIQSCDDNDFDYCEDTFNHTELIDELKWLEFDSNNSTSIEIKHSFENEIDELKALSQVPLENIIDESYFHNENYLDDTLSSQSDSVDNVSLYSQSISEDNCDKFVSTNFRSSNNIILSNCEKLKLSCSSEIRCNPLSSLNDGVVHNYLKNYSINQNVQLLFELLNKNVTFAIVSPLQCGDDRFLLTVLLGYLSQTSIQKCPILLITTIAMISEWCKLISKICPKAMVILLDSYAAERRSDYDLSTIATSNVICITSYGVSKLFALSDVNWSTVIYDQFEKYCEHARNDLDISCFERICCSRKVALVSGESDSLDEINSLSAFFKILYSSISYKDLLNDIKTRYSIKSNTSKIIVEKLKRIAANHFVSLMAICNFGDSYHIIMCELTQTQHNLHKFVINKLKRSLDSSSLLDIIEVVSQDVQISHHPSLFDYSYSDSDYPIFKSLLNDPYTESISSPYNISIFDTVECYIPQTLYNTLMKSLDHSPTILTNCLIHRNNFNFHKQERIRLAELLISSSNLDDISRTSLSSSNEYIENSDISRKHSSKIETSSYSPFLSPNDIKRLKLEGIYQPEFSSNVDAVFLHYNSQKCYASDKIHSNGHHNVNHEQSQTKSESYFHLLCHENNKYIVSLQMGDYCYPSIKNTVSLDLSINSTELNALQILTSITKRRIEELMKNFRIIENKVTAMSPKLLSKNGKINPTMNCDQINSITSFYRTYFFRIPERKQMSYITCNQQFLMSGKLRTLHQMFRAMATDKCTKKYIVVSHNFHFLNLIESMLFINNNYHKFKRLRLNASLNEDVDVSSSIVDYFNKCHRLKRSVILLVHARCDSFILDRIDASFSSIILVDSHWQTDSDILVKRIINRWNLNCIINRNSISSICRLCSFGSLEQFFLTNDLSFVYDSTYTKKNSLNSISGAIICQQSLLKNFVDKLPSPIKEELISGFYVDDFQSLLQSNNDFIKLPHDSVCEIFNSFEGAYDLSQLCNYQALRKLPDYELNHPSEIINHGNFDFPRPLYFLQEDHEYKSNETSSMEVDTKTNIHNWELCRIQRLEKLKHLQKLTEQNNLETFCDLQKLDSIRGDIIQKPLCVDENSKYLLNEIRDMYELEPIPDTDLSLHVVPTKLFYPKDTGKIHDEKFLLPSKMPDDILTPNLVYNDSERIKKRRLSNEIYPISEMNQFNMNLQKKRKIYSNRRYNGDQEIDLSSDRTHLKSRLKLEKKNINERDVVSFESKELNDATVKKQPIDESEHSSIDADNAIFQCIQPSISIGQNNTCSQLTDGNRFNSVIVSASAGSIKVNLQRPFYLREGWKALKSKRQHVTNGSVSNLTTKINSVPSGNIHSHLGQQRLLYNKGQFSLNAKFGNQPEVVSQSNSENENEKLPEWSLHEEAILYQNVTQHQDYQFSSNGFDKFSSGPNFKLCEHFMTFYAITNNHRSSEMCKIHFNKLQSGYTVQNTPANALSRNNKNQILNNPVISGVAGRKLKIKMKNSIGTYGTTNSGASQASTSKIKMFQYFLNDMKLNLLQTNQIINSSLNSFDNMVSITSKMLDEVVNKSRLPSLLPNHSQTIKKNATHMNALEEHSIHPDKIFTPAMLIQRREDLDKERESESVHITSNQNRQQIINPISSNYRSPAYLEGTLINSTSHSLGQIRRSAPTNIAGSQNIYSIQGSVGNQVRPRYNMPLNRQAMSVILKKSNSIMSGATVIHQSGVSQTSNSGMSNSGLSNNCNLSTTSLSSNQVSSMGSRNQIQHFQIQQPRNSTVSTSRRPPNQPQVMSKLVPYTGNMQNYQLLRQNTIGNRQATTSFARPTVSTVLNQSNTQNASVNNSIIVFPNSHEQPGLTTFNNNNSRLAVERNVSIPLGTQFRNQNVRSSIPSAAAGGRGNIIGQQIPRMMSINNTNNNRSNINNPNNVNTGGRNQD